MTVQREEKEEEWGEEGKMRGVENNNDRILKQQERYVFSTVSKPMHPQENPLKN